MYDLNGYEATYKFIVKKDGGGGGGGVFLNTCDETPFATGNDLGYRDPEMESPFIEVDEDIFRTNNSIVNGLSYNMPDPSCNHIWGGTCPTSSSSSKFYFQQNTTMEQYQEKGNTL